MKALITSEYRHLLWQDELGESFLLLKYAEVFEYSKEILRLHCWGSNVASRLRKMGLILNERSTDDPLYILDVKTSHLLLLISLGAFQRRPHIDGAWLKNKERLLAHRILPYRPRITSFIDCQKVAKS